MKKSLLLAAALALGFTAPALAGGDHAKSGKSDHAKKACEMSAEECLAYFAKKADNYGWVGIELDSAKDEMHMVITKVVDESPAMSAGFKVNDVLWAMNGVELVDSNKDQLKEVRGEWVPGQTVTYTLRRGNKDVETKLTLGKMPREVLAQIVGAHMLDSHSQLAVASQ
jgi:C-terminal processing protease CtpA/Prc